MATYRAKGTYKHSHSVPLINVSSLTYSQVISQRAELTALVGKVIDQLGVLTIFSSQDLLELKYRGINCASIVFKKDAFKSREDLLSQKSSFWLVVKSTFGGFQTEKAGCAGASLLLSSLELIFEGLHLLNLLGGILLGDLELFDAVLKSGNLVLDRSGGSGHFCYSC